MAAMRKTTPRRLETVRDTLTEGRKAGAVDFFLGGDINIELRLGNAGEDLHGLDSIERYGMYGPQVQRWWRKRHRLREENALATFAKGMNSTARLDRWPQILFRRQHHQQD